MTTEVRLGRKADIRRGKGERPLTCSGPFANFTINLIVVLFTMLHPTQGLETPANLARFATVEKLGPRDRLKILIATSLPRDHTQVTALDDRSGGGSCQATQGDD